MNKLKNYILMAAGFAVLAGVVAGITAGPAIAQAIKAALVKNVDEPGRQAYQIELFCTGAGGCSTTGAAIPANRRLVAKYLSVEVYNTSSKPSASVRSTNPTPFALPDFYQRGPNDFAATQPLTMYYDSGQTPVLGCQGTGANVTCDALLVGYLVDLTL
jgi:hypothetical protein